MSLRNLLPTDQNIEIDSKEEIENKEAENKWKKIDYNTFQSTSGSTLFFVDSQWSSFNKIIFKCADVTKINEIKQKCDESKIVIDIEEKQGHYTIEFPGYRSKHRNDLKEDFLDNTELKYINLINKIEPLNKEILENLKKNIYKGYAGWLFKVKNLYDRTVVGHDYKGREEYNLQNLYQIFDYCHDYKNLRYLMSFASLENYEWKEQFVILTAARSIGRKAMCLWKNPLPFTEIPPQQLQCRALMFGLILGEKWMSQVDAKISLDDILKLACVKKEEEENPHLLFVLGLYYESLGNLQAALACYDNIALKHDDREKASQRSNVILKNYQDAADREEVTISAGERHEILKQRFKNDFSTLPSKQYRKPTEEEQLGVDRIFDESCGNGGCYPAITNVQENLETLLACADELYNKNEIIKEVKATNQSLLLEIARLKQQLDYKTLIISKLQSQQTTANFVNENNNAQTELNKQYNI